MTEICNELRFNIPLDTKQVILETLFPANLLASTEKTNSKSGETITKSKPRLTDKLNNIRKINHSLGKRIL